MSDGVPAALADRLASLAWPHPLRRHQREALEALDRAWSTGRRRAWVVLPPGAGKTLVGLETIRRAGTRAVVLSPNTAIQGQWLRSWARYGDADEAHPVTASGARDLSGELTSLTYQSIAVFGDPDDEAPPGGRSELGRLHENGLALVSALRDAGPITLVLDECHHLLEVWGRLLAELLDLLPEARVLGLTATPAATLTTEQERLVDELFGDVVYATSIPAVVREGHLAPFADLVWLTEPSAAESAWLDEQGERFAELTTALVDPAFGSVPFLAWVDRRFAGDIAFERTAVREPALADAALRLAHAGLLRLPDDVPRREEHRRPPSAEDWVLLVDDWYDACLAESVDDRDDDVRAALRRALPSVGYQLTRRGLRRGRSGVDRVLARSESKSRALVEIVAAEHRALGERLAMLVITDHESAAATVAADLRQVLDGRAGSARLALATLLADPVTRDLDPVMVTGRTVAGAPAVLRRLGERVAAQHGVQVVVGEPDADGVAELSAAPGAGGWTSRVWVRAVTDLFTDGGCRVLIGTRALLGEGWDAPVASGLVDLSTATTPGTVVQTRGRTLRLDPDDPAKVAVNWTVTCVADGPRGDNDWRRTVAKHDGYFGVDETGDVVDGVAHIHPDLSPHAPPDPASFDRINAEMLDRAERRADIAAAWRVGEPYDDEAGLMVWLRPTGRTPRTATGLTTTPTTPDAVPLPRSALLTSDGLRGPEPSVPARDWAGLPVVALSCVAAAGVADAAGAPAAVLVALVLASFVPALVMGRRQTLRHRAALDRAGRAPDLVTLAHVVADALHTAGLSERGAEAVEWHVAADGTARFRLEGRDPVAGRRFAEAFAEAVAPVVAPRYLVPRYLTGERAERWTWRPLSSYRPEGVAWHPVPSLLGARAETARAYADAWQRWVGGGPAVFTGSPEGAGALAASRGSDPFDVTSVLRLGWS